jgi:hypothetical protein
VPRWPENVSSTFMVMVNGDHSGRGRGFVMRDETIVVKVLDSQTRLAKAGPAGQVVDGTVTLAGMLLK